MMLSVILMALNTTPMMTPIRTYSSVQHAPAVTPYRNSVHQIYTKMTGGCSEEYMSTTTSDSFFSGMSAWQDVQRATGLTTYEIGQSTQWQNAWVDLSCRYVSLLWPSAVRIEPIDKGRTRQWMRLHSEGELKLLVTWPSGLPYVILSAPKCHMQQHINYIRIFGVGLSVNVITLRFEQS